MVRAVSTAIVVLTVGVNPAALPQPPAGTDLKGKLYKSVFFPGPGALAASDVAALPAAVRPRLERYLQRRSAFTSKLQNGASNFEAMRSEAKKRVVERAMVALIEAPQIEDAAAAYVGEARIFDDWHSRADSPLAEAAGAEEFLKKDASTPLAPYLYVFIAERQRAAFELMTAASQKAEMTAAAKKYRTFMQRARSAADPIFTLLAGDMDRQAFLYANTGFHPRDFDPDT